MLIIRRSNCIYTACGIVTLYKWTWWPCSMHVERGLSQPVYCTDTTSTYREWRYQMLCVCVCVCIYIHTYIYN